MLANRPVAALLGLELFTVHHACPKDSKPSQSLLTMKCQIMLTSKALLDANHSEDA